MSNHAVHQQLVRHRHVLHRCGQLRRMKALLAATRQGHMRTRNEGLFWLFLVVVVGG